MVMYKIDRRGGRGAGERSENRSLGRTRIFSYGWMREVIKYIGNRGSIHTYFYVINNLF